MNQYGEIIDQSVGADTTTEEALELYKNMVKRTPNQATTYHPPANVWQ